jgi:hypothetical protein
MKELQKGTNQRYKSRVEDSVTNLTDRADKELDFANSILDYSIISTNFTNLIVDLTDCVKQLTNV